MLCWLYKIRHKVKKKKKKRHMESVERSEGKVVEFYELSTNMDPIQERD